ncbi:MAG: response regulator [Sulfuricurvum sp.]|nr:response regulator [Sulfuricurvum sp.]
MGNIRLLIVDDVEDNRLVLKAICRKIEGFEIQEAQDGLEAVEKTASWLPNIILMDIMMPKMDGFEASKIIKERYPATVIIAVTAVIDPHMEEKMSAIGVAAYIHKPIDKELIRFKLKSFQSVLRAKQGEYKKLSEREAVNPFSSDIRYFKTVFENVDPDAMMDFGMWILGRCEDGSGLSSTKVDALLELFYELMRHEARNVQGISIVAEESFEALYVTLKFPKAVVLNTKASALIREIGADCRIREVFVSVRLGLNMVCLLPNRYEKTLIKPAVSEPAIAVQPAEKVRIESPRMSEEAFKEPESVKEKREIQSEEKSLLRQSFVQKTNAIDYVSEIGGDVLDEIRDLESLDAEWKEKLYIFEQNPTPQNLYNFIDGVLGVYVSAINNLFEFTALAYALSSLGVFLKENVDTITQDPSKLKVLVMLTEHLGADLVSWREHVFELRDTADIHYLDSSFFSSCMQIEGIIGNKEVCAEDDDDDGMEFF